MSALYWMRPKPVNTVVEELPQSNQSRKEELAQNDDDRAFTEAKGKGNKEAFEAYLQKYPSGRHTMDARSQLIGLDDSAYQSAVKANTIAAYERYGKEWPQGRHYAEAEQNIDKLRPPPAVGLGTTKLGAEAKNTEWWMPNASTNTCRTAADAAIQYHDPNLASPDTLTHEPGYQGAQTIKDAQGNVSFVIVNAKLTSGGNTQILYFVEAENCNSFMRATSKARFQAQIDDDHAFEEAKGKGNKEAFEAYLQKYPSSRNSSSARALLDALDARAYQSAVEANSFDAYEQYRKLWPQGKFYAEAGRKKEEIAKQPSPETGPDSRDARIVIYPTAPAPGLLQEKMDDDRAFAEAQRSGSQAHGSYGSVYVGGNGEYGFSYRWGDQNRAMDEAARRCRKEAGSPCRRLLVFANECAAVVLAKRGGQFVYVAGSSKPQQADADANALAICRSKNPGASCELVERFCSN